jgi:ribA/ribD-fused uncharacterized protein
MLVPSTHARNILEQVTAIATPVPPLTSERVGIYPTERIKRRIIDWISGKIEAEPPKPFAFSNYQPCAVAIDGVYYRSVEHAYWASRTENIVNRRIIARTQKPGNARWLGLTLTPDRKDWREIRTTIMYTLLWQKFSKGTHKTRLLESEGLIQYWNFWCDVYWGQCLCKNHMGAGMNVLGNLIMDIRETLLNA